jgi:uncharacterized protein YbaP (TraB family)
MIIGSFAAMRAPRGKNTEENHMNFAFGRSRRISILTALLVALALAAAPARGQPKDGDKLFLWKATSKTNTVVLLGSMHLASKAMYPLPAEIEDAFAGSKTLVVEADIEKLDQVKIFKFIKEKGMYAGGETLSKSLSKTTRDSLDAYCAKKGMKAATLDPMRPWLAYMMLATLEAKAAGHSEELGIDKHFLKKARAGQKSIVELETADSQLEMFAGFSPELQEKLLAMTLEKAGKVKETLEKITAAWKTGDAKTMEKAAMGDPAKRDKESSAVLEKMFDERNVKMVDRIEGFLKAKDQYFVVVGAGHLVGPKGIVKLLEAKGYQVEQVRRAAVKKKAA